MDKLKKLTRDQLRKITGGTFAVCIAQCGKKHTVSCSGDGCSATDDVGCTNGDGTKTACPES